jgi:hypothetical protein
VRGTYKLLSKEGGTFKTLKETKKARGTYSLLRVEAGIHQKVERDQASLALSQTVKHRGRDDSE